MSRLEAIDTLHIFGSCLPFRDPRVVNAATRGILSLHLFCFCPNLNIFIAYFIAKL